MSYPTPMDIAETEDREAMTDPFADELAKCSVLYTENLVAEREALIAELATAKAQLAEFDGFPNLTAMRQAMVDAADECRELKAWRYEAEQLLRLCVDSVHRDGRPHLLTMIQAALGDAEDTGESADDPSRCPECGLAPQFDGMWHKLDCLEK